MRNMGMPRTFLRTIFICFVFNFTGSERKSKTDCRCLTLDRFEKKIIKNSLIYNHFNKVLFGFYFFRCDLL